MAHDIAHERSDNDKTPTWLGAYAVIDLSSTAYAPRQANGADKQVISADGTLFAFGAHRAPNAKSVTAAVGGWWGIL